MKRLCDVCGRKWIATPLQHHIRVSKFKAGCPQCNYHARAKKSISHPTLAESKDPQGIALLAEWDHERNAMQANFPSNTTWQSAKPIFWLCCKCPAGQPHRWCTVPYQRTGRAKSGCPYCAGHTACKCNSLQALYPDIAAEWDYAKNKRQPCDHTASSTNLAAGSRLSTHAPTRCSNGLQG